MCAELYIFKTDFDPIMLPNEHAHLITASEEFDVECIAVGALPEYEKDFGALTAASWDTDQEDTNLEMASNELAQLRMRVVDDMKVRLNNLSPTRQWRTSKTDFYLRKFPEPEEGVWLRNFVFKSSEFFIWEDDTPRFDFYSPLAKTKAEVIFSGWRFKCKKVTGIPKPAKTIWVSGWPSGIA